MLALDTYEAVYGKIFHEDSMDGRYTDEQTWEKYGLPARRGPGEPVKQGQLKPSFSKRFVPVTYGLADIITEEDWSDDQYGVLARALPSKGGALAEAHAVLKERVAADFLRLLCFAPEGNNVPGMPDGRPLFSSLHPVSQANTGTTYSNRPSVDVDLSIASYQQGASNLRQQFAPNSVTIINNEPRALIINPNLRYVATQILRGDWERGTADRNMNVIKDDNIKLIEWAYFRTNGTNGAATNAFNAWILQGKTHYLRFFNREEVKIKTDYNIAVLAYIFVSYCRFVVGVSDARGVYGSKGG